MKTICQLAFSAMLFAVTATAFAHSGGTDRNGCHYDHSTGVYHCHNPKK